MLKVAIFQLSGSERDGNKFHIPTLSERGRSRILQSMKISENGSALREILKHLPRPRVLVLTMGRFIGADFADALGTGDRGAKGDEHVHFKKACPAGVIRYF